MQPKATSRTRRWPMKARCGSSGPTGRCPCSLASASASRRRSRSTAITIAACLHVTTETANLMRTLEAGGADVALCASNPLSTQDETAASLVHSYEIPTFAIRGVDDAQYYGHIKAALDRQPKITMDDGGDLVTMLHQQRHDQLPGDHRRHRGDDDRRHPSPSRWKPMVSSAIRSSRSTTPTRSISSTTVTEPASPRSTASSEQRTC